MRSPRLAALELKRFGRGKLPRAAMAAMLLLPLLYGALYLWSFWDPYDRLDRIPVALVNEDQGATVKGDGGGKREKITAGDDIVKGLYDSDTFDWHETSAAEAREGLEDGDYYLTLTVPEDFSQKVASSSGDRPETGALKVRTNDANNYIVGQISRTVFTEVRASASSKTSRGFYDKIFVSFSSLHDSTQDAADGATDLKDGIGKAKKGTGDLEKGTSDAKRGSEDLKEGVSDLNDGARDLEKGAKKVAEGTQKLADKVGGVSDSVEPFLKKHEPDIAAVARDTAKHAKVWQENVKKLPGLAQKSAKLSRAAANDADRLYNAQCDSTLDQLDQPDQPDQPGPDCTELKKLRNATSTAADTSENVNKKIAEYEDLDTLHDDLGKLRTMALDLEKKAPGLGDDVRAAVKQVNALNKGAKQVHSGAGKLHRGLTSAKTGAGDLDSGLADLASGARSLNGGMFKLADGSGELSKGLHDGAKKIPDYDEKERGDRSSVMADPVQLASGKVHTAPNYGTGFAPYFIPLSLWVGAMVAYMLLQPLNRRALAAGAPAWRTALAGWLPVAAIGALQVAALLAVLHWGLGLEMARTAGTVGFLLLVTACFAAIIQWLNAQFGPAGRILVLALLMLQLTSAGGTYPVQTSPDFFNAIHAFLPMSYVVEGLRHLITGGGLSPVWQACAVLLAFTAGAVALTAWTARRSAVWTMKRLHPELTL